MGNPLKLGKIRWLWMLIGVVVLTGMLTASALIGKGALGSCIWAIAVSAAACGCGLIPISWSIWAGRGVSAISVLAGGAIRLLLMLFGTVTILAFVKANPLWFAIWIGLLYIITLVAEVLLAVRTISSGSKIRG